MRVLVADDNVDAANALAMLLDLSGHEVRVVFDGREAVEAALQWPPDAAILDICMPGLDGYEVAAALRRGLAHPAVLVALSGHLDVRQRDMALARVFDLCFAKGVDFQELREQLERSVARETGPLH